MTPGTVVGKVIGLMVAPIIVVTTLARRGRTFHTAGAIYHGTATSVGESDAARASGERLAGDVLVRFSSGIDAKLTDDGRDLVGLTLRFEGGGRPVQDFLMASFRSAGTVRADAKTSSTRHLLENRFWTVSPSKDPDLGKVTWRAVAEGPRGEGGHGFERLEHAIEHGEVQIELQAKVLGTQEWMPIVQIVLDRPAEMDDRRTSFSPQRTGRDIRPYGVVEGVRSIVYPVGRFVRGGKTPSA